MEDLRQEASGRSGMEVCLPKQQDPNGRPRWTAALGYAVPPHTNPPHLHRSPHGPGQYMRGSSTHPAPQRRVNDRGEGVGSHRLLAPQSQPPCRPMATLAALQPSWGCCPRQRSSSRSPAMPSSGRRSSSRNLDRSIRHHSFRYSWSTPRHDVYKSSDL